MFILSDEQIAEIKKSYCNNEAVIMNIVDELNVALKDIKLPNFDGWKYVLDITKTAERLIKQGK